MHHCERFFSARRGQGGTGLGLRVVRGFASGHDVELSVKSELGKGTLFIIEFPAVLKVNRKKGARAMQSNSPSVSKSRDRLPTRVMRDKTL